VLLEGDGRTIPERHFDPQILETFRRIHSEFQRIHAEIHV